MELTQQQLQFFATFGYMAFPGLFENEIDNITESFERFHQKISFKESFNIIL